MKNLTWQNPEQLFVAQELINKVKSKCCGIKVSDEFWTICKGYNRPLDPVDGLIIQGQDNLYPWQEPEYVSIDAALKKKNIENWGQVADVEKEYLEELKVVFRPKK